MPTRHELLEVLRPRYRVVTRAEKARILDQLVAISGYHRKHAVRLLNQPAAPRGSGRKVEKIYNEAVRQALVVLWEAADRICGKRLKAMLPLLIEPMDRHGHLALDHEVRERLLAVSPATIDRMLATVREGAGRRRRRPLSSTSVRRRVPVRTFADWGDPAPGYFEADFVAHGGGSPAGRFLHTFVVTDIASGWTEGIPMLVRQQHLVVEALKVFRARLPVPLLGFDSDNDGAFINETVIDFCASEGIEFTRSRPYRKNDQAWVEQKNGSIVRRMVGYDRIEGIAAGRRLGRLLEAARLYVNFFQPSFKLREKKRIGARVVKSYFTPATPCDRLLGDPRVAESVKARLREQRTALDPIALLKAIRDSQAERFQSPSCTCKKVHRSTSTYMWAISHLRRSVRRSPSAPP